MIKYKISTTKTKQIQRKLIIVKLEGQEFTSIEVSNI